MEKLMSLRDGLDLSSYEKLDKALEEGVKNLVIRPDVEEALNKIKEGSDILDVILESEDNPFDEEGDSSINMLYSYFDLVYKIKREVLCSLLDEVNEELKFQEKLKLRKIV